MLLNMTLDFFQIFFNKNPISTIAVFTWFYNPQWIFALFCCFRKVFELLGFCWLDVESQRNDAVWRNFFVTAVLEQVVKKGFFIAEHVIGVKMVVNEVWFWELAEVLVFWLFLVELVSEEREHLFVEDFEVIFRERWLGFGVWVIFEFVERVDGLRLAKFEVPGIGFVDGSMFHFILTIEYFFDFELAPDEMSELKILSFCPPASFFHDRADEVFVIAIANKVEKLLSFERSSSWLADGHWEVASGFIS